VDNVLSRWCKRNSCFLLVAGLTALMMGGCPPTAPPGNDNEPPAGHTVNVIIAPTGSGTVSQEADGELVTLTATPAAGFAFDGWSGADLPDQDQNPITVNAADVDSITANFVESQGSPSDSDGDGVRDTVDDCPNTAPGTPVDATGCPATGPDSDEDGVPDSADRCANTAAGAEVDTEGCAATQRDADNDGVNDANDDCANTPATVDVDDAGCPVSEPGTPDSDDDGVPDDIDQCDETPAGADVDPNGCAESERDTDADGVFDDADQCPATPERTIVDSNGCPVTGGGGGGPPAPGTVCGNSVIEAGEQCDDGNQVSGDGCSAACQNETSVIPHDRCSSPNAVTDGSRSYSNSGADTDGPDEPGTCNFAGSSQVSADIWYCYTATCTGTAFVSLCGSHYDTKLAVYGGCGCPSAAPLACSDDDCGRAESNLQSRVEIQVTAGQQYMLRVGGFRTSQGVIRQGAGRLTIGCNAETCAAGSGDCFAAHTSPGCGDATCCAETCDLDQFCCDVTWDQTCAGEAQGICTGSFAACAPGSGSCEASDLSPGCDDVACCNTVCRDDPYCCLTGWDATCVDEAEAKCFLTCRSTAGDCAAAHQAPGCNNDSCCRLVCAEDEVCCHTTWDQPCVSLAAQLCP